VQTTLLFIKAQVSLGIWFLQGKQLREFWEKKSDVLSFNRKAPLKLEASLDVCPLFKWICNGQTF